MWNRYADRIHLLRTQVSQKAGNSLVSWTNISFSWRTVAWTQLSPTNSLFLNLTVLNQMYTLYRLSNLTTLIQPFIPFLIISFRLHLPLPSHLLFQVFPSEYDINYSPLIHRVQTIKIFMERVRIELVTLMRRQREIKSTGWAKWIWIIHDDCISLLWTWQSGNPVALFRILLEKFFPSLCCCNLKSEFSSRMNGRKISRPSTSTNYGTL